MQDVLVLLVSPSFLRLRLCLRWGFFFYNTIYQLVYGDWFLFLLLLLYFFALGLLLLLFNGNFLSVLSGADRLGRNFLGSGIISFGMVTGENEAL